MFLFQIISFLMIGVWICESWFIINYFVPFDSFWLDLLMESLYLYLKVFGNMLYPWNVEQPQH